MNNPFIGLDISKGQSEGQAFLDKGQPYGKSFSFFHTQEGLQHLLKLKERIDCICTSRSHR
jgi:hypothetical protein